MAGPQKAGTESGLRDVIRGVLSEDGRKEKLSALVDSAFELKRLADAFCPDCRRKVRVEVPDLRGTVQVLVELLEQADGKPGTSDVQEAGVTLIVERSWPVDGVADRG